MVEAGHIGTPLVSSQLRCVTVLLILLPHCVCSAVQQTVGCTGSGLRGTEMRIDCTITDGPRCPAHVVTYAEANFKWDSAMDKAEAVGQLWVSLLSAYDCFVQT